MSLCRSARPIDGGGGGGGKPGPRSARCALHTKLHPLQPTTTRILSSCDIAAGAMLPTFSSRQRPSQRARTTILRGVSGTPEGVGGRGGVEKVGLSKAEETARALAEKENEKYIIFGWCDLRLLVLLALVVQNACQMLSMRYSRVAAAAAATPYLPSTAVVFSEVLKVVVCLGIILYKERGAAGGLLWRDVVQNWRDSLMVSVPAFVYMVQNNLLYVAASNLDAASCQITYQLKILTTALFAVGMLGKQISALKWLSLFVLLAGVILVQMPSLSTGVAVAAGNPAIGFAAVVTACFMSGFAGIYFEKVLKGTQTSIWMRNVQMGSIGAVLAVAAAFVKDGEAIAAAGFFQVRAREIGGEMGREIGGEVCG